MTINDNDGWLTDNLPEDFQYVLIWYEYYRYGSYNRMYETYGIAYQIQGKWYGVEALGFKAKVLAWQPLPQPYERADKKVKR